MKPNGNDTRPMVERVAEAIWMANRPPGAPRYEDLDFRDQDTVEVIARACIEAMRHPTDSMVSSVARNQVQDATGSFNFYRDIWECMIEEALAED